MRNPAFSGTFYQIFVPSFHKYDVLDYYAVAEEYGTIADLEELIGQCRRRGIRIILDLMTGEHPLPEQNGNRWILLPKRS